MKTLLALTALSFGLSSYAATYRLQLVKQIGSFEAPCSSEGTYVFKNGKKIVVDDNFSVRYFRAEIGDRFTVRPNLGPSAFGSVYDCATLEVTNLETGELRSYEPASESYDDFRIEISF